MSFYSQNWPKARARLKKEFAAQGIMRCEMCGKSWALTFAHRKKCRFVTTEEELMTVALLCTLCHIKVEAMTHVEMCDTIDALILKRNHG